MFFSHGNVLNFVKTRHSFLKFLERKKKKGCSLCTRGPLRWSPGEVPTEPLPPPPPPLISPPHLQMSVVSGGGRGCPLRTKRLFRCERPKFLLQKLKILQKFWCVRTDKEGRVEAVQIFIGQGGESIFGDFVRTSFTDGPLNTVKCNFVLSTVMTIIPV